MQTIPSISIIVPTLNEAGNIEGLVQRIEAALSKATRYEIIFIDDHSRDNTVEMIKRGAQNSFGPVSVFLKKGKGGKAFSLIEGFSYACNDLICMIDADLQYPPEVIPEMIDAIANGNGIVVANRIDPETNFIRSTLSQLGRNLYGKWLHGLDLDVQSGLKLFRKEVLEHVRLEPTPWTFDLEFLVQARDAGYKIGTVCAPFSRRTVGESDVHVIKTGLAILTQAIKLKFTKSKTACTRKILSKGSQAGARN